MRTFSVVTTLLLAAVSLAALAPTAQAVDTYCIEGEPNCPRGQLACVLYPVQACVIDPCYTTQCTTPASTSADPCWRQDYGHFSSITCIHPTRPDCVVERWNSMATETFHSCSGVPLDAGASAAAAETCYHMAHGPSYDSYLCYDVKGDVGCKVYNKTYTWGEASKSCIA